MNPGEDSPGVAVVGAGIGGLACAAFLARAGLVVPLSSAADLAAWFAALARRFPIERSALEAIRADAVLKVSSLRGHKRAG